MNGLDKKDIKILFELEKNSRQPYSSIAKKVQVSKQAVNYRINRLIEKEVISNFVSIIDTHKLGHTFYLTFLQFGKVNPKKEAEIMDFLKMQYQI